MTREEIRAGALDITAQFETSRTIPEAYGNVTGDFDDMGISFGVGQFNYGWESLDPIFNSLLLNNEALVKEIFEYNQDPSYYNKFRDINLNGTHQEKLDWGGEISTPDNERLVIEPWKTYMENLGMTQPCIDLQIGSLQWFFEQGERLFHEFNLWSKRGYALMFDLAIQNGTITDDVKLLIWQDWEEIDKSKTKEAKQFQPLLKCPIQ